MRDHNIRFYGDIWIIIPVTSYLEHWVTDPRSDF